MESVFDRKAIMLLLFSSRLIALGLTGLTVFVSLPDNTRDRGARKLRRERERKLSGSIQIWAVQSSVPPSGLETGPALSLGRDTDFTSALASPGKGRGVQRTCSSGQTNVRSEMCERRLGNEARPIFTETGILSPLGHPPPTLSDHKHNFQSTCR